MIGAAYTFTTVLSVISAQSVTHSSIDVQNSDSLPVSPCPKIFTYEQRSTEAGKWYGVINLTTEATLYSLWLNIVLDNEADILGNWVGEVTTKDHIDFKVENTKMQINPGPPLPVRFFVQYNPNNKTPKLKYIRLNGKEICNIELTIIENYTSHGEVKNRGGDLKTDKTKLMTDVWPGTNDRQTTTWKPKQSDSSSKSDISEKLQLVFGEYYNASAINKTKLDGNIEPWLGADTKKDTFTKTISNSRPESTSTTKGISHQSGAGSSLLRPKGERNDFGSDSNSRRGLTSTSGTKDIKNVETKVYDSVEPTNDGFNIQSNFNERGETGNTRYDTNDRYIPKTDASRSTGRVPQPAQTPNRNDEFGILYERPSITKFTEPEAIPTRRPDNDIVFTTSTYRTTTRKLIQINSDSRTDEESDVDDYDSYVGGIPTIYIPTNLDKGSAIRQKGQCGKVVFSSSNPIFDSYGSPTLEGQYPWQVALYKTQRTADNKYICGGTLVSHRHVVTAAHCVARPGSRKLVNKNTLTLYLGKYNLRTSVEGVQVKFVENIIIHPEYNATTLNRDIAVLQLKDPITYTDYVRPVCLWPENLVDLNSVIGKQGSLVGWGSEVSGNTKQELNLVKMPVMDQETCSRSYNAFLARIISDYSYCAAYAEGTTACNGDSGGGMVFKSDGTWYVRGVASLSIAQQNQHRCDSKHFVIFTDVAKLLPWIRNNIYDY